MALAVYCMIISCLGASFLLFIGILVATGSHLIHEHPKNRTESAWMLILASVLYMIIFGLTVYFKYLTRVREETAAQWMNDNQNGRERPQRYIELK